jgi:hypothetical protein
LNNLSSQFSLLAALLAPVAAMGQAQAAERPLAVYNQGALARAFELPVIGETGVLPLGDTSGSLRYDLTTEYHASGNGSETVVLDGESNLLTFAFRKGLGWNLELTLDVPVLYQSGGFMDDPIESWHDFFGLPNGGRELAPQDRYLYQYTRGGETGSQTVFRNTRSGTDLGDVRLGFGWQALDSLAVRTEFKLPSGDDAHLAGGNTGGALWADWALPFDPGFFLSGWVSAGVSINDESEVIADQQNSVVPFGGAGLAARFAERWSLLGQLYTHGKLYDDSALDPFREALQLTLGLRYDVARDFGIDVGFQEDLITSSSPDFSFHLALNWRSF